MMMFFYEVKDRKRISERLRLGELEANASATTLCLRWDGSQGWLESEPAARDSQMSCVMTACSQ
jgi:hypothetical protein